MRIPFMNSIFICNGAVQHHEQTGQCFCLDDQDITVADRVMAIDSLSITQYSSWLQLKM
jgi:hypothetical protein